MQRKPESAAMPTSGPTGRTVALELGASAESPPSSFGLPIASKPENSGESNGPVPNVHPLSAGPPGDHPPVRSLYIHIPFCSHKCHYCDFYSFVDTRDQQEAFLDRLEQELIALAPHACNRFGSRVPLRTIFIGGGTPSLLRVPLWRRLLTILEQQFDLSLIRAAQRPHSSPEPTAEFTVECNPESVTAELLETLVAGGVGRVSMGAQSFHPAHLKTLERLHDPARIPIALDLCAQAGIHRRSIDLIYAIPGQTLDQWREDLRIASSLGLSHISCYNLTYEPNTAMYKRLRSGEFAPADEDLEADMFQACEEILASSGLRRYEVSNYAVPGQESLHNLAYWRHQQWLAAGPSASGHLWASDAADRIPAGFRWKNVPRLGDYLAGRGGPAGTPSAGLAPAADVEGPDNLRAIREFLMMGLRVREGVDLDRIRRSLAAAGAPDAALRFEQKLQQLEADAIVRIINAPSAAHAPCPTPAPAINPATRPPDASPSQTGSRLAIRPSSWLLTDWVVKQLMPE